jgi:hypothetical protein
MEEGSLGPHPSQELDQTETGTEDRDSAVASGSVDRKVSERSDREVAEHSYREVSDREVLGDSDRDLGTHDGTESVTTHVTSASESILNSEDQSGFEDDNEMEIEENVVSETALTLAVKVEASESASSVFSKGNKPAEELDQASTLHSRAGTLAYRQ